MLQGARAAAILLLLLAPTAGFVLPSHQAFAQDTSPVQHATQNGATLQFQYSPSSPTINGFTTLTFSVVNATTGKIVQNYVASVTVGSVAGYTGGSGYYNFSKIAVTNGTFSVNYAFPNDGLFPVFFRADYPTSVYGPGSPIAIGEFKVTVPPPQVGPADNTIIYVGVGIAVAAAGGGAAVFLMKRKPSGS